MSLSNAETGVTNRTTSGAELTILSVWRNVRKHWAMAVGTALAVALAVAFYTLGQTKIYRASATVQLDPNPPRPLGKSVDMVVDLGTGTYWNNREYYETQYKIMQSLRVAVPVVIQLDLHNDSSFVRNRPPGAKPLERAMAPEEAAELLRARLKVEPVKESRLAVVHFEDADPARAQRILSVMLDTYVEQNLDYSRSSTTSAVDWLGTQLDKVRGELESNERALHQYKLDKNVLSLDPDAQSNMLREEMKQLNDELTSVRAKKQQVKAQRDEFIKIEGEDPSDLPANELLQSPLIQQLRQRYEDAVRERAGLLGQGKGEGHPDVVAADRRVNAARSALKAEVRNVKRATEREFATVARQESGLSGLFEAAKRRALELNLLEVDYNRLRRSRDNSEKLYGMLLERTKESDLARMMQVNNIRIVDRPMQPRTAIRPRVSVNVGLGIFGGIALGIAAAMARGLLDRTLKTPDDVETDLGLAFLGLLPEIGSRGFGGYYGVSRRRRRQKEASPVRPELIVHDNPMSGVAEAARAIRTNLMFMSPDEPYKTLLVTSPAPAEGKTTVAVCIAVAMAQAGQRVVVIDCDLRRPRVHRVFGKKSVVGVTSALVDGASLDEIVQETEVPNLWFIPAGPLPPNPAELFHSERFKAFLRSVSGAFDRVIIDSPPVVTVTDAAVLSTLVDGVVLVIRAFSTAKDLARHGVRAIRDVGGKTIGAVLNAVNLDRHEYKYHYYYYRRAGEYYQSDEAPKKTDAAA
ncbi:MAG: polysaccharide biosynthesis tyrosine autokinase [Myxococcales bacterium]|nr:polysaccharide biosynthesis tyrosine autokinase [Myxococcales bacterium]